MLIYILCKWSNFYINVIARYIKIYVYIIHKTGKMFSILFLVSLQIFYVILYTSYILNVYLVKCPCTLFTKRTAQDGGNTNNSAISHSNHSGMIVHFML